MLLVQISVHTVEFHLSGLIGTASHSDTQKIWIIEFIFENKLQRKFELGEKLYKRLFIYVQIKY